MIIIAILIAALVVAIISLHPSSPRYMLAASVILTIVALLVGKL